MARAYVFIETAIGKTPSVVQALRQVPGVRADATAGPYDAVVVVEAQDPAAIGLVIRHFHTMEGITRTLTSFVVG